MREQGCWLFKAVSCVAALSLLSSSLAGCIVPEAAPLLGHERKKRVLHDVIRGVQCEIRKAVLHQLASDKNGDYGVRKLKWFEKWNALISLTLRIDDTIAFNPGLSLKTPNWIDAQVNIADGTVRTVRQEYNFGVGGGFTYEASRQDVVTFAYPFSQFLISNQNEETSPQPCYTITGVTIESDLMIEPWLDDVLEPIKKCAFLGAALNREEETAFPFSSARIIPSSDCLHIDYKFDPINSITHEIDFILTFDMNATPSWNLVRVSTPTTKLFEANRKDTSRLLISFGPPGPGQVGGPKGTSPLAVSISPLMQLTHGALLTGSAVSDAQQR